MKQYTGITRDHSISMRGVAKAAARDYNSQIASIKSAAVDLGIDTIVSVIKCGVESPSWGIPPKGFIPSRSGSGCQFESKNSSISALQPLRENDYGANGGSTPLYDSVGHLINAMKAVPDYNDPQVSFLIMAITDGEENSSSSWSAHTLKEEIRRLTSTDKWTFVFRVPNGHKQRIVRDLGVYEDNVLEWEQTTQGFERAAAAVDTGIRAYYTSRSIGATSVKKFFVNTGSIKPTALKQNLVDISREVKFRIVPREMEIKDFFENVLHETFHKGIGYYQLTKTEKVQPQKEIAIFDKNSNHVYSGQNARDLLGIPHGEHIKLVPGAFGQYDVYIQSTSSNRKLVPGTQVLVRNV